MEIHWSHFIFCRVLSTMLTIFVCYISADSLMHRTAVAEMLHLLEPNKKSEAVKLIEESSNNMSM